MCRGSCALARTPPRPLRCRSMAEPPHSEPRRGCATRHKCVRRTAATPGRMQCLDVRVEATLGQALHFLWWRCWWWAPSAAAVALRPHVAAQASVVVVDDATKPAHVHVRVRGASCTIPPGQASPVFSMWWVKLWCNVKRTRGVLVPHRLIVCHVDHITKKTKNK